MKTIKIWILNIMVKKMRLKNKTMQSKNNILNNKKRLKIIKIIMRNKINNKWNLIRVKMKFRTIKRQRIMNKKKKIYQLSMNNQKINIILTKIMNKKFKKIIIIKIKKLRKKQNNKMKFKRKIKIIMRASQIIKIMIKFKRHKKTTIH